MSDPENALKTLNPAAYGLNHGIIDLPARVGLEWALNTTQFHPLAAFPSGQRGAWSGTKPEPCPAGPGRGSALTLARLAACIAMAAGRERGPRPGTETPAGKEPGEAGKEPGAVGPEPGEETAAGPGSDGQETRIYPSRHRARPSRRNRIYPGVHRAGSGGARA